MDSRTLRHGVGIATVMAIAIAAQAGGCRTSTESEKTAERFMTLYYGEASATRAVTLCTGDAERKLRQEIDDLRGASPTADRPAVTWNLLSHTDSDPAMRTYVYEVVPHTADLGSLITTLGMVRRNGRWLVSFLVEKHAVP
jgi:hypothetical protein